jgi:hypothetical protein
MSDNDHADFSPSATARWMACEFCVRPGEPRRPRKESKAAVIGTALHQRSEEHLKLGTEPNADPRRVEYRNPEENNEISYLSPEEWRPHVAGYVEAVREYCDELELAYGAKPVIHVERKIPVEGDYCWGTADVVVVIPKRFLAILDLKTGSGHYVEPNEPQFLTYLCGALVLFADQGPFHNLEMGRFQAAFEPAFQTVEVPEGDAAAHYTKIRNAIAQHKLMMKTPGRHPEARNKGEHCHFCPYKMDYDGRGNACPAHVAGALAALAKADASLDTAGAPLFPEYDKIPVDRFRWLLFYADEIIEFLRGAKAHATDRIAGGAQILGFKVVQGDSKRKWSPDLLPEEIADKVSKLADNMGVEIDLWEKSLTSFTKIEKLLGKGSVDEFVVKPPGKPKLVRDDDERPAVNRVDDLLLEISYEG